MVFKKNEDIIKENATIHADETIKKYESISEEDLINHIKEIEDKTKSKGEKRNIYPYWVIIFKNDVKIKSFGVRKIAYKGIELLIRIENVNGNNRVVFKELYPESKFDPNTIYENRIQLKQELNRLKQIKTELEKELYNSKKEKKSYNYSLKDVKLAILERELDLQSIQYGRTFKYSHDLREDKVPVFLYDQENVGLKLIKKVKERSFLTEGTEIKRLNNVQQEKEINEVLPKSQTREWLKVVYWIVMIIFLGLLIWGTLGLFTYNEERAFQQCNIRLDEMFKTVSEGLGDISSNINANTDNQELIKAIQESNRDLLYNLSQTKTTTRVNS
jgi:hypothetical protein